MPTIQKSNKKIYLKFFLLIMTFVVPIMVSWFLYSYHDFFQLNTTNHGVLINPPIQVKELLKNDAKLRQWNIVYIPSECQNNKVQETIYTLHQLRKALGKNQDRISLILATNKACSIKEIYNFRQLLLTHQEYMTIQNNLKTAADNKIYLVDPIGNLFMYYPSTMNPMNILKDIKKVLEVSQIG